MAKKKRSAAPAAAAVDSDASKKQKPEVHEVSFKVVWPPNVSPQTAKLSAGPASSRALRTANAEATSEEAYGRHDYVKFAKLFEAAVSSAFAKEEGPVSLSKVITAMTKATGRVKIGKWLKHRFAWDGFSEGRWQISRAIPGRGQVPFPKGSSMPSDPSQWKFSPSPASRRPLANLSK